MSVSSSRHYCNFLRCLVFLFVCISLYIFFLCGKRKIQHTNVFTGPTVTVKVLNCNDLLVPYPGKPSGMIRSNKIYRYSNNMSSIWRFSSNTKLHLIFSRFTTPNKRDYLAVYDGNTMSYLVCLASSEETQLHSHHKQFDWTLCSFHHRWFRCRARICCTLRMYLSPCMWRCVSKPKFEYAPGSHSRIQKTRWRSQASLSKLLLQCIFKRCYFKCVNFNCVFSVTFSDFWLCQKNSYRFIFQI